MQIPLYIVDAFTNRLFSGNPAAVCPLEQWLGDEIMQAIAAENNLSETAFFVKGPEGYHLRWFTPRVEVDLCGHATLASAHVLFHCLGAEADTVSFQTRSGNLTVTKEDKRLSMDFPARELTGISFASTIEAGVGVRPEEVYKSGLMYLAVFRSEGDIRGIRPDFAKIAAIDCNGIIVTAKGENVDFVSRFFGPRVGIPEDPVTGSAHCTLIPYWSKRLNKTKLHALQISPRGGELFCEALGERVKIAGQSVIYSQGNIELPEA